MPGAASSQKADTSGVRLLESGNQPPADERAVDVLDELTTLVKRMNDQVVKKRPGQP
jgi:hypothetical protein